KMLVAAGARGLAGIGRICSGGHLDQSGLAGAVVPNERHMLTLADREVHLGQGLQAAEPFTDSACLQDRSDARATAGHTVTRGRRRAVAGSNSSVHGFPESCSCS